MADKTYNDGLEAAAQYLEARATTLETAEYAPINTVFATLCRDEAAAIRALKEPKVCPDCNGLGQIWVYPGEVAFCATCAEEPTDD